MSAAQVEALRAEVARLNERVAQLEQELFFLRTHPVFIQGLKGETVVAKLTGGQLTSFAERYDVKVGQSVTLEVKFSKLNSPVPGRPIRRWNWSKPLGYRDKGKAFDFLILVGEKDNRFSNQYLDDSPYIFFLVPKARVPLIMTKGAVMGANVQVTTRLSTANSPSATVLKSCVVTEATIRALFETAHAV